MLAIGYECPVCLEGYVDQFVVFSCKHGICKQCAIDTFAKVSQKCPVCRHDIDDELNELLTFDELQKVCCIRARDINNHSVGFHANLFADLINDLRYELFLRESAARQSFVNQFDYSWARDFVVYNQAVLDSIHISLGDFFSRERAAHQFALDVDISTPEFPLMNDHQLQRVGLIGVAVLISNSGMPIRMIGNDLTANTPVSIDILNEETRPLVGDETVESVLVDDEGMAGNVLVDYAEYELD